MGNQEVEVRRSRRRRHTVSAYREDGRTVVLIPAAFSRRQEKEWVTTMLERLAASDQRRRPSDQGLDARAAELSRRFLGGQARPSSIRWVTNQRSRWGSCTPAEGTIRISTRLQGMPGYVIDYVVLHELTHLLVAGHGPDFWALMRAYPKLERARGYLDGVAAAKGLVFDDDSGDANGSGDEDADGSGDDANDSGDEDADDSGDSGDSGDDDDSGDPARDEPRLEATGPGAAGQLF